MLGRKYGGLWRQLIAGLAVSLSLLSSASVFAWVTPILPTLLGPDSVIPMTPEEASWMLTMPEFGNLISPLPAGLLADRFGRKIVILISAPIFFIGWIMIIYFKTLLALNLARILQGVAIGIVYAVVPTYLGEIASPKYRGAVTSVFYCQWWLGFLLEYVLGPKLSFVPFTYATAFTSVMFFVAFLWQPESPYFLLMKNDTANARRSLAWFLNDDVMVVDEVLEQMKHSVDEDLKRNVTWKELIATPADRKALTILFICGFIRQFNGTISLSMYATQTLKDTGDDFFIPPDSVTTLMGVLYLLGSICSVFTMDVFGRKTLLLYSCFISGLSTFCAGTFYFVKTLYADEVSNYAWVPPVSFFVLSSASVSGIFPVNVAFCSELFTSNTRGIAASVFTVYTTVIGVFVIKMYLTIYYKFGVYVNFYIFTLSSFIGVVLAYFVVPETKGRSFEQIRHELKRIRTSI